MSYCCNVCFAFLNLSQIEKEVKNLKVRFPHQLFINNEFVDSSDSSTFETINPADESVGLVLT